MKPKQNMGIYTCIWIVAIIILSVSLFQNFGDAKVINYSGIVRGATQKLVKEELAGQRDDQLIDYLDGILIELQTGEGHYGLDRLDDKKYQMELKEMNEIWDQMKDEIYKVRNGKSSSQLYALSQTYFDKANDMVATAQDIADYKLISLIRVFVVYLILTISVFYFWYRYKQKQIKKAMYVDELTGISNLIAFEMKVDELIKAHSQTQYVMISFDIDDFKFINSTYGNELGDEMLKQIALSIDEYVGEIGTCARYGNDHFYVLCEYHKNLLKDFKHYLKDKVCSALAFDIYDNMRLSVGGYQVEYGDSVMDMIDNANIAHKSAKASGRGQYVWYNQDLLNQIKYENMMQNHMKTALENHEFKMYLQPKFKIPNIDIVAAEALVRWNFKNEMLLFPDEFIPLFEKNGFIYDLDFYIFEQVCQFIMENHLDKIDFRISVNFSRVSLHHKHFYKRLLEIVKQYQVPTQSLEIEITETAFHDMSETMIEMLNRLRDEGFSLSIDDFGTGYSSLNSINTIPVDTLKIDKAFLMEQSHSEKMVTIVGFIVDVAHTLGMKVICEGVETKRDVEMLARLKCSLGQGYYVSKPIPHQEFLEKFIPKIKESD